MLIKSPEGVKVGLGEDGPFSSMWSRSADSGPLLSIPSAPSAGLETFAAGSKVSAGKSGSRLGPIFLVFLRGNDKLYGVTESGRA
jgi:hypothetical protein